MSNSSIFSIKITHFTSTFKVVVTLAVPSHSYILDQHQKFETFMNRDGVSEGFNL